MKGIIHFRKYFSSCSLPSKWTESSNLALHVIAKVNYTVSITETGLRSGSKDEALAGPKTVPPGLSQAFPHESVSPAHKQ